MANTLWDQHKVPVEELCERFETNIETGLTSSVAQNRDYENIPTPPPTTPAWVKLCFCLLSGPSLPLLAGAILYFVVFCIGFGIVNLCLSAGLILIVIVSGIFSYFQQSILNNMMKMQLEAPHAVCLRDGVKTRKKVEDLRVGDIVQIEGGDTVPADVRILESRGLKVDNSKLYGEPETHAGHLGDSAAQKRDNCSVCAQSRSSEIFQENHLESQNLAFYSTHVVEGSGVGMVVKIGDNTELAKNAATAHVPLHHKNVIKKRVNRSVFLISSVIVAVGTALFVFALIQEYIWLYSSIIALSIIPVAIQASKEMTIKSGVRRLASKNGLVKGDEAVMNLGTISSLYTSKTGNITQNRMTVNHIWINNEVVELNIFDENGKWKLTNNSSWKVLERAAVLCNNAYFIGGGEGINVLRREAMGNTTDGAIFKLTVLNSMNWANQCADDGKVMAYREQHKKVCEIPFNSERKFQLSIHEIKDEKDGGYLVVMKGAPEKILKACKTVFMYNKEIKIDEQVRNHIESAINQLAGYGDRVIAFCDLMLPQNDKSIEDYPFDAEKMYDCLIKDADYYKQGFRFLGLISLIDPPRAMIPDTITKLKSKDLKVVMVTADHPVTAGAIAKSVGILPEGNDTVIHGDDVREMKEDQVRDILKNNDEIVFARTDPQTKSSIIRIAQSLGEVVAFAGTDLNDIPAMKAAHVGIAMGNLGSNAAENAADMILLGHGMQSIVAGVDELKDTFKLMTKLPFNKLA